MSMEHNMSDTNKAKRKYSEKPVSMPLRAPQISQRQAWDRNPASAVTACQLTAKPIARPFKD